MPNGLYLELKQATFSWLHTGRLAVPASCPAKSMTGAAVCCWEHNAQEPASFTTQGLASSRRAVSCAHIVFRTALLGSDVKVEAQYFGLYSYMDHRSFGFCLTASAIILKLRIASQSFVCKVPLCLADSKQGARLAL